MNQREQRALTPTSPADVHLPGTVLIVGAGLIGTSIALSLRGSSDVALLDADQGALEEALARSGARRGSRHERYDHAVIAVPPAAVADVVASLSPDLVQSMSDVASVKTRVVREVRSARGRLGTFVPTHPFAGRERGGPAHAAADLFVDRQWVVCEEDDVDAAARRVALAVIDACGAVPVFMTADAHDRVAARLSHVPQLTASAIAATSLALGQDELALAGQGFRDVTRIAASPPALWGDIVASNAGPIVACLDDLVSRLETIKAALAESVAEDETHGDTASGSQHAPAAGSGRVSYDDPRASNHEPAPSAGGSESAVEDLIRTGNRGRARLPLKAGRSTTTTVVVTVSDRAGELARLLLEVATTGINVEDVHVQHGAMSRQGSVELDVAQEAVPALLTALAAGAWTATIA